MMFDEIEADFRKNHPITISIIRVTEICGRGGIALRGKEMLCKGMAVGVFVFKPNTYLKS